MSPSPVTYQTRLRKGQVWQDERVSRQLQSTFMDMTSLNIPNSVKQAGEALSHFKEEKQCAGQGWLSAMPQMIDSGLKLGLDYKFW